MGLVKRNKEITRWEDNEEIRINMDTLLSLFTQAFLIRVTFLKGGKQTCFFPIFSFSSTCTGKTRICP